jgi:hypothetical protein
MYAVDPAEMGDGMVADMAVPDAGVAVVTWTVLAIRLR